MKVKVLISTPKGQASGTEKKLRPWLIGSKKKLTNIIRVSPEDDQIVWEIDSNIRTIMKIQRNVNRFDGIIQMMFENKMVKGAMGKMKQEDQDQLKDMLNNHTKCEVIGKATAEEIIEDNKTWWQRVQEKWKKKKEED